MRGKSETTEWGRLTWLRAKRRMEPATLTRAERHELKLRERFAALSPAAKQGELSHAHCEALAFAEYWRAR